MKIEEQATQKITDISIPEIVPVLPSQDVIYPSMIVPMAIIDEKTIKLIDDVTNSDKIVGLFVQQPGIELPLPSNLYKVGTAASVLRMLKMPDGSIRIFIQGICRIQVIEYVQNEPYLKARVGRIIEKVEKTPELEALRQNVLTSFQKIVGSAPNLPNELAITAMNLPEPGNLADFVAAHINLSLQEQQEILETDDVKKRLEKLTVFINRELEILELRNKIQSQAQSVMEKAQREFFLREQLKAIQKELGEVDERTVEINELKKKIDEADLSPEAKREAERELDRLSKMPPQAAEYITSRTYLDWLISLPWSKSTNDNLDVERARLILDEDHYNLEKVKERVLDYLAVRKLKADMKGPILCFIGPPGTGKTSVGRSIARALGRQFVRISLGGIRDEAEIRGHRRTYVGALPGRIIQGIRRAGSNNPVFMLDEIDKIGADFRGDPSAALLEVLDPEQNFAFSDHYLEVPFDLSRVMFIATANLADPIPPALRDRMEILELPGYTEVEKLHISRKFIIPKQLKEHGLSLEALDITDDTITTIVRNYTREAGLRNLEREISTICRKIARMVAEGNQKTFRIDTDNIKEFLGPQKFRYELAEEGDEIGVATGLAWTQAGGDILFVEATLVPGKGNLILTGQLGEVMQESARAALTLARSRARALGIDENFYTKNDVHIHVPAGAIPKDGPSAGVTMTVALISALLKKPFPKTIGMTGEITLRGKILPVGGIKEKVLAANRAGVKKIILPADNEKDLEEVPQHVRNMLTFVFVKNIDEVLKEVLSLSSMNQAGLTRRARKRTVAKRV